MTRSVAWMAGGPAFLAPESGMGRSLVALGPVLSDSGESLPTRTPVRRRLAVPPHVIADPMPSVVIPIVRNTRPQSPRKKKLLMNRVALARKALRGS